MSILLMIYVNVLLYTLAFCWLLTMIVIGCELPAAIVVLVYSSLH